MYTRPHGPGFTHPTKGVRDGLGADEEGLRCGSRWGGVSGVIAAVASARAGAKTLLVEKNGFFGGTVTASRVGQFFAFYHSEKQTVFGIPYRCMVPQGVDGLDCYGKGDFCHPGSDRHHTAYGDFNGPWPSGRCCGSSQRPVQRRSGIDRYSSVEGHIGGAGGDYVSGHAPGLKELAPACPSHIFPFSFCSL